MSSNEPRVVRLYLRNRGDMSVGIWPWGDVVTVALDHTGIDLDTLQAMKEFFAEAFDATCLTENEHYLEIRAESREE